MNLGNPQRKKFEYKNKVQCNACKLFGHNIGEQVCRYAAMHVNTIAYCTENPEMAKKNMKKFNASVGKDCQVPLSDASIFQMSICCIESQVEVVGK